ncbi:RNA-binding protein [Thiocystis violacea]|uniref:RNA-binding protein n=1 Tax=Thiocystis violacea TaxID=13725 RepID=UPI0019071387|nr:RNA-binding protein [Thiocystis violacea]MBK1721613.1 hypothetical protein [Thiocystis violacea]
MEVFIGNLPARATLLELTSFLEGVELRPDFQCHEGRDRNDRNYHYFVARIPDHEAGRALIRRLNGLFFRGQAIEAREYRPRAPCSDWQGEERRVNVG